MTLVPPAPTAVDPAWPASLRLLLGPSAGEIVQAVLPDRLRLLRVVSASVQPAGAAVVRYAATVDRADGPAGETIAATTGGRIPDGAAVVDGTAGDEPVRVGLWRWPHDPGLPALAAAADPETLAATLAAAGLRRTGPVAVRLRAYRPGRRAVLEVTGGGPRLFGKVVRPGAVDGLRARHEMLAPHLPVPEVLTATADGLLVLPEADGEPVRAALDPGRTDRLPDGPAIDAVLDRLPPALLDLPARRDPAATGHLARARHFADVLSRTAATGRPGRLDDLASRLAGTGSAGPGQEPVHGDFYESQLFARAGTVTGLLDVDTAGPGHRVDDWATLLAHLSVLGGRAHGWGAALLAHAEGRFDRGLLRPRVAAAVLGLATGPFRVQQTGWATHTEYRICLAERWFDSV